MMEKCRNVTQGYTTKQECDEWPQQVCTVEKKTVVEDRPEETCSLRAQPFCEYETKLVPVLKPRENCVDVPKEVCVRMRSNPRPVKKPVIKKWCYTPTEESGLSTDDDQET